MDLIFRFFSYVKYWFSSQNNLYIHSPFIFEFYKTVLRAPSIRSIETIDKYRIFLDNNSEIIHLQEFGAKEKGTFSQRKIATHYKKTSISDKYGRFLLHLVQYMNSTRILELGTSLGVSTTYLSVANPRAMVTTMDAQKSTLDIAKQYFKEHNIHNVTFIEGKFEETLMPYLNTVDEIDVCFIDGNHTYEATLNNGLCILNKMSDVSVMILDDIRWSRGMYKAWETLRLNDTFNYTVDLGRIGLLFKVNNNAPKQHFVIK